jgi:hypothetical protein
VAELPNWVYDLLIELQHQRDVHPKLFVEGGKPADWCPCALLDLVPTEVRRDAAAIREYLRRVEQARLPVGKGEGFPPSGDALLPPHNSINAIEGVQHNE